MASNFYKISKGLTLTGQASAPSSPVNGDIYYNSTDNKVYFRQAGAWVTLTSLHSALVGTDIHVSQAYTYADAATRLAATGFVSADVEMREPVLV